MPQATHRDAGVGKPKVANASAVLAGLRSFAPADPARTPAISTCAATLSIRRS